MSVTKILDFSKYVEDSNAAFEAADASQKRVIIAQDVIARINSENLIPETGWIIKDIDNVDTGIESFKDFINQESCTVCAKGALFCSLIGRVNEISVQTVIRDVYATSTTSSINCDRSQKELLKYFTMDQIDLIETAFEGKSFLNSGHNNFNAVELYESYDDDKDRLTAICENIIYNKGEFIP